MIKRYRWGHLIVAVFFALFLTSCSTSEDGKVPLGFLSQEISDDVVEVPAEHRALRVCLLSAGAVEVMTDLAQYRGNAELALGKLMLLQNAIDKSRNVSDMWIESDMADVAILFAGILRDAGRSSLAQVLLSGPTISNFIYAAKRATVVTVKGHAVITDINRMLSGVKDGTLDPALAWEACEERMDMNRDILMVLTGGTAGR